MKLGCGWRASGICIASTALLSDMEDWLKPSYAGDSSWVWSTSFRSHVSSGASEAVAEEAGLGLSVASAAPSVSKSSTLSRTSGWMAMLLESNGVIKSVARLVSWNLPEDRTVDMFLPWWRVLVGDGGGEARYNKKVLLPGGDMGPVIESGWQGFLSGMRCPAGRLETLVALITRFSVKRSLRKVFDDKGEIIRYGMWRGDIGVIAVDTWEQRAQISPLMVAPLPACREGGFTDL